MRESSAVIRFGSRVNEDDAGSDRNGVRLSAAHDPRDLLSDGVGIRREQEIAIAGIGAHPSIQRRAVELERVAWPLAQNGAGRIEHLQPRREQGRAARRAGDAEDIGIGARR